MVILFAFASGAIVGWLAEETGYKPSGIALRSIANGLFISFALVSI